MFLNQILYQNVEGAFTPWIQLMMLVLTVVWKFASQLPKPSRMSVLGVYVLMLWLISLRPETERASIVDCLFVLSSLFLAAEMTLFVFTEAPERIQTALAAIITIYTCTSERVSFYYKSLSLFIATRRYSAPTPNQLSTTVPSTILNRGADL